MTGQVNVYAQILDSKSISLTNNDITPKSILRHFKSPNEREFSSKIRILSQNGATPNSLGAYWSFTRIDQRPDEKMSEWVSLQGYTRRLKSQQLDKVKGLILTTDLNTPNYKINNTTSIAS